MRVKVGYYWRATYLYMVKEEKVVWKEEKKVSWKHQHYSHSWKIEIRQDCRVRKRSRRVRARYSVISPWGNWF